eukprot:4850055-Prymnesium_polylepis.2
MQPASAANDGRSSGRQHRCRLSTRGEVLASPACPYPVVHPERPARSHHAPRPPVSVLHHVALSAQPSGPVLACCGLRARARRRPSWPAPTLFRGTPDRRRGPVGRASAYAS